MSNQDMPPRQRALILQGGGALGAYNIGVFEALYDALLKDKSEDENHCLTSLPELLVVL
jgi:predicted patatin/cPLA2 family phospholipase